MGQQLKRTAYGEVKEDQAGKKTGLFPSRDRLFLPEPFIKRAGEQKIQHRPQDKQQIKLQIPVGRIKKDRPQTLHHESIPSQKRASSYVSSYHNLFFSFQAGCESFFANWAAAHLCPPQPE
jgi:hypothetical protein